MVARGDVAPDGTPSNGRSWAPVLSGDGRHLLFVSEGTNLAAASNGLGLLLKDLDTGTVHHVGYPDSPYGGGDLLGDFGVSDDGGVVAYRSRLPNFGGFRPNVWIRATGEIRLGPTVLTYDRLTLSGDGGTVAISGDYTYAGDSDVFVMDVQTLAVESACVSSLELRAARGGDCIVGALSQDGRFVAFTSGSGNLVPGDVEGTDAFIRDRTLGTTELVTYSSTAVQLPDWGWGRRRIGGICDDGSCVSFVIAAPGVLEDTNGGLDVYVRRLAIGAEPAIPLADASGPYHGWAGRAVTFDAARSSSGTGLPLSATWSFGDGSAPVTVPGGQPLEHVYVAPGTYTASVTVSDGQRVSSPSPARVEVLETPPGATGVLSVYPSCGGPGTVVTVSLERQALTAGASWNEALQGAPGSILEAAPPSALELSVSGASGLIGPSSLPVTRLARTAAIEYTASAGWGAPADLAPGTYTLAVGDASAAFEVPCPTPAALANQPVAMPGGPYSGVAGTAVGFDGTGSTDPRGRTLTYTWDFGDGTTATGARVEHAYAEPGTYRAALSVDNGEQASNCGITGHCSVFVPVALAEVPPPPPPAAAPVGSAGGCGCMTSGTDGGPLALLLVLLAPTVTRRRRRP
jgi:MYXO-CTERM domain-containing protein